MFHINHSEPVTYGRERKNRGLHEFTELWHPTREIFLTASQGRSHFGMQRVSVSGKRDIQTDKLRGGMDKDFLIVGLFSLNCASTKEAAPMKCAVAKPGVIWLA